MAYQAVSMWEILNVLRPQGRGEEDIDCRGDRPQPEYDSPL
jgi:hypothetical protein